MEDEKDIREVSEKKPRKLDAVEEELSNQEALNNWELDDWDFDPAEYYDEEDMN